MAETVNEPGTLRDRLRRVVTIWAEHDLADPALQAEMQAYAWVWPRETEADNERQLEHGFKSLHAALDMAIADGEIPPEVDKSLLIDALFAIYTHGLRPRCSRTRRRPSAWNSCSREWSWCCAG